MDNEKKQDESLKENKNSRMAFNKPELKVIQIEVEESFVEAYAASTCTTY